MRYGLRKRDRASQELVHACIAYKERRRIEVGYKRCRKRAALEKTTKEPKLPE